MKNVIKKFMEKHGYTYQQMADYAGFRSSAAVFFHATGQRKISAESAQRYARAFGIPLAELRPDLWPPESKQKGAEA